MKPFEFHIHIHNAQPQDNDQILNRIQQLENNVMSKLDDFRAVLAEIDADTTRVGNRIEDLVARLESGELNETEEQEVFDALKATSARLRNLASDPEAPVPPVEEPETPV